MNGAGFDEHDGHLPLLGIKGTEFELAEEIQRLAQIEHLAQEYRSLHPFEPMPKLIPCMARPLGIYGGPRCRSLFCGRCHNERQLELRGRLMNAMDAARARQLDMRLLTLTLPGCQKDRLYEQDDLITRAWRATRRGEAYRLLTAQKELLGIINVPDVTFGERGWHSHIHAILISASHGASVTSAKVLQDRYIGILRRQRFHPNARTFHDREVNDLLGLAEYLSKSWHLPSPHGLTLMRLLKDALDGSVYAATRFFEAMHVFKNKQRGAVHTVLAKRLTNDQTAVKDEKSRVC